MRLQHDLRLRDLLLVVLFMFGLYVAWELRKTLLLIYVGLIFAIVFLPAVDWIARMRLGRWSPGRGLAILLFFAAIAATLAAFVAFAAPPLTRDAQQFAQQMPEALGDLRGRVQSLPFGATLAQKLDPAALRGAMGGLSTTALGIFKGLAGGLAAVITIVLVTAYFMYDGRRAFVWSLSFVPQERRDRLRHALVRGRDRVQRWLVGQLILMAILAGLTLIVLGLMGVKYFYALALFAGLANFVPILGPFASMVAAGAVAALDSWGKFLGVIAFYAAYQQLEDAYLTPRIMRSTVQLPGITVVIALAIGAELAGLLGAMVAVPTAALIGTVLDEYRAGSAGSRAGKEKQAA